ncbi:MAG: rRNA maturation RNase YbeY [bacterium]|nr:rRNA maturation RNase YbeY [bacterium]
MIEINNLTASPVDKKFLEKIAGSILKKEKKLDKDLSIALVGSERMRELNKKYRGKNLATDVLSFQYGDSGEVAICLPQVKKNARRFKFTFKKELARVLIHGILHLLGFNHEKNEKEADKMRKKEADYLFLII